MRKLHNLKVQNIRVISMNKQYMFAVLYYKLTTEDGKEMLHKTYIIYLDMSSYIMQCMHVIILCCILMSAMYVIILCCILMSTMYVIILWNTMPKVCTVHPSQRCGPYCFSRQSSTHWPPGEKVSRRASDHSKMSQTMTAAEALRVPKIS